MPKKIRELKSTLRKAGFKESSSKGSHTKWSHPLLSGKIVLSGKDGTDAKPVLRQFLQRAEHPQRTVALSRKRCRESFKKIKRYKIIAYAKAKIYCYYSMVR